MTSNDRRIRDSLAIFHLERGGGGSVIERVMLLLNVVRLEHINSDVTSGFSFGYFMWLTLLVGKLWNGMDE